MSAGRRVLLVGERDVRHPLAGDAERYLHEVARRWAAAGTRVTWSVTRPPGSPAREVVEGVEVVRSAGWPGARTALWLLRRGGRFDAVVDATTGPAFAVPLVAGRRVPVVRVAHRVVDRPRGGAVAKLLARWTRDRRATVVTSPSARHALRRGTGVRGPVFIAPPGAVGAEDTADRAADPVVVVLAPPAPEWRPDPLLRRLAGVPGLRVEVVGDGPREGMGFRRRVPERAVPVGRSAEPRGGAVGDGRGASAVFRHRAPKALPRRPAGVPGSRGDASDGSPSGLAAHGAGVARAVTFHGRLSEAERAALLRRAWLVVSATTDEVSASAVLEAAAHGVPCVALDAVGARDFVRVGEVVRSPDDLGPAVARHLAELADPRHARRIARRCRDWAGGFRWDRTARLLAAAVEHQVGADRHRAQRRRARSDIAALVRLPAGARIPAGALRVTDEVAEEGGAVGALLNGCDEFDALGVLERLGVEGARVRLATHDDLLLGPCPPGRPTPGPTREADDRVHSR
ncbi:glycosyltransferase family 4 protein [Actinosynnema sp. NPDC059797]